MPAPKPHAHDSESFGEKDGERGLRVSSERFGAMLGDNCAVGIRQEDLERFLRSTRGHEATPAFCVHGKVAEQLVAELRRRT